MAKTPGFKITKRVEDLLAEQRKPGILPETGWWKVGSSEYPGVGFTNGWDNTELDGPPASWYLAEDGEVRIRGQIFGGADNTVVTRLPEEVRPEYVEIFVCPVDDDGNIDLSGIKFRAYQAGDLEEQ